MLFLLLILIIPTTAADNILYCNYGFSSINPNDRMSLVINKGNYRESVLGPNIDGYFALQTNSKNNNISYVTDNEYDVFVNCNYLEGMIIKYKRNSKDIIIRDTKSLITFNYHFHEKHILNIVYSITLKTINEKFPVKINLYHNNKFYPSTIN